MSIQTHFSILNNRFNHIRLNHKSLTSSGFNLDWFSFCFKLQKKVCWLFKFLFAKFVQLLLPTATLTMLWSRSSTRVIIIVSWNLTRLSKIVSRLRKCSFANYNFFHASWFGSGVETFSPQIKSWLRIGLYVIIRGIIIPVYLKCVSHNVGDDFDDENLLASNIYFWLIWKN